MSIKENEVFQHQSLIWKNPHLLSSLFIMSFFRSFFWPFFRIFFHFFHIFFFLLQYFFQEMPTHVLSIPRSTNSSCRASKKDVKKDAKRSSVKTCKKRIKLSNDVRLIFFWSDSNITKICIIRESWFGKCDEFISSFAWSKRKKKMLWTTRNLWNIFLQKKFFFARKK